MTASREIAINMVLVDGFTQLDLIGPHEVLVRMPGARIELVASSMAPVASARGGLAIVPTATRASVAPADLLVVPGGRGVDQAIVDPAWVSFVREAGASARWIFGICTGTLLLGAAGLLRGRRATGHWLARDLLSRFGANVCDERSVVDGNVYTAGGVTAGIDMALRLVADLAGEETAKGIQLQIEYEPEPPFRSGTPFLAAPELVAALRRADAERRTRLEAAVAKAAASLAAT
jgi:cyclohexyl-isocyanide hydratase